MGAVLPLLALRAFVETARHGNLTRAAAAMGVTPGAVSQQLRALQARTGVVLFQRFSHGMRLTPEGEQVYPGLRQAFEQITASLAQLEAINARQTLTVSTEPSFAATWLVPRLGQFSASHPQVEVRVEATALLADLRRERIDVAIRHGLGDYPGLDVQALMAPPLIPVASPRLLLLDEPFSALDALTRQQLQEELLAIRRRTRITTLLVTHDVEEALYLADRVVVMEPRPGRIRRVVEVGLAHPRERGGFDFLRQREALLHELTADGEYVAPPPRRVENLPFEFLAC